MVKTDACERCKQHLQISSDTQQNGTGQTLETVLALILAEG